MALSASRIAAFEFLIQFRSIGRNKVRGALLDMNKLTRATQRNQKFTGSAAVTAAAYRRELLAQGRSAVAAQHGYDSMRRSLAKLQAQQAADATRARVANYRNSFVRAGNSRTARGITSVFGQRAGAAATKRLAGLTRGFSAMRGAVAKVIPVIGQLVAVFQLFAGAILRVIGFIARWAKANALIIGGIGLLAVGLAKLADGFTNLTNRIRVASSATDSIKEQTNDLLAIALRSRAPFNTVADLYGRIALNAKGYGVSLAEAAKFTELAVKTAKIGGANPRELEQAFLQLSQGLGSNRLSGDELRSVREQTPALAAAIAEGLGVGIGELKKLGESGALTTKKVVDALISQQRLIDVRFSKVEATFADGTQNIGTSLKFFVGSVLSAMKLGPRWFAFTDRIAKKFSKMAKSSGVVALALRRLPRLFEALGRTGVSRFLTQLGRIGAFFTELPDSIQKAVDFINIFVGALERGATAEEAARQAGTDLDTLKKNSTIINISTAMGAFIDQLLILTNALKTLAGAVDKTVRAFTLLGGVKDLAYSAVTGNNTAAVRGSARIVGAFRGTSRNIKKDDGL